MTAPPLLDRCPTSPIPVLVEPRVGSRGAGPAGDDRDARGRRVRGRHRLLPEPTRHNGPLLWVGQVVNTTGLMMLVPVMPFYVEQLGVAGTAAASTWAGVAIAAPALVLTVATPLWGRVGDRVGRKWMVVRALLGLALAMVVMALAASPLALVGGRLLQGLLGGVVEAASAFASAVGPGGSRGKALGRSFSATAAGSLLGPVAGGLLVGSDALPLFMLAVAAAAIVAAVGCAWGLREPAPGPDEGGGAPRGADGGDPGAGEPGAGEPDADGRRVDHVVTWRAVPRVTALSTAAVAAYFGVYGLIPVFAARVRELEPAQAGGWVGVLHAAMWGASLVSSAWWGRRNDRLGRPLSTFAFAAGGCAVAIAVQAVLTDPWLLLVPRILLGACFAALAQSLFLYVGDHAAAHRRSALVGAANSFLLAGQSAGPLLAGPLLSVLAPFAAVTGMAVACAVAAVFAARAATARPSERAGA